MKIINSGADTSFRVFTLSVLMFVLCVVFPTAVSAEDLGFTDIYPDNSSYFGVPGNDCCDLGSTDIYPDDYGYTDIYPDDYGYTDIYPDDYGYTDIYPDDYGYTDIYPDDYGYTDIYPDDYGYTDIYPDDDCYSGSYGFDDSFCYSEPSYRSTTIGGGDSSWAPVSFGSRSTWSSVNVASAYSAVKSIPSYFSYTPAKPVVVGGGTSVHYVTQPAKTKVVYVPKTETKYVEVAKPVTVYRDVPTYHYDTPAAPTCTITATKTGAQTYTLNWYSYGSASSAAITNIGTVNVSGSRTVNPYTATTYVMTVYGAGGSNTCETTVQGGTPNVMVTLNQVPYTGLDLGPMGTAVYFLVLSGVAIAAAYMLFFWRGGVFYGFALAGANTSDANDATIVNEYTLPGYGNTHDTIEQKTNGVTRDSMKMMSDGVTTPKIVITRR